MAKLEGSISTYVGEIVVVRKCRTRRNALSSVIRGTMLNQAEVTIALPVGS